MLHTHRQGHTSGLALRGFVVPPPAELFSGPEACSEARPSAVVSTRTTHPRSARRNRGGGGGGGGGERQREQRGRGEQLPGDR